MAFRVALFSSPALPRAADCCSGFICLDQFAPWRRLPTRALPPMPSCASGLTTASRSIMPQVEMGQGTYTSMSMLIAEELEVALEQVGVEAAPPNDKLYANPLLGFQVTGGSTSVPGFWEPLRRAGATARVDVDRGGRGPVERRCGVLPGGEGRGGLTDRGATEIWRAWSRRHPSCRFPTRSR